MVGHKICLNGETWIIITKLSLLPLLIWSTNIDVMNRCKGMLYMYLLARMGLACHFYCNLANEFLKTTRIKRIKIQTTDLFSSQSYSTLRPPEKQTTKFMSAKFKEKKGAV